MMPRHFQQNLDTYAEVILKWRGTLPHLPR